MRYSVILVFDLSKLETSYSSREEVFSVVTLLTLSVVDPSQFSLWFLMVGPQEKRNEMLSI